MNPTFHVTGLRNRTLAIELETGSNGIVARLTATASQFRLADAEYRYRLAVPSADGVTVHTRIRDAEVSTTPEGLTLRAQLGPFDLNHEFRMPPDGIHLSESVTLTNNGPAAVDLVEFDCGFGRHITGDVGHLLAETAKDRFVAVPFRHRPTDPVGYDNDFSLKDLIGIAGARQVVNADAPLPNGHGVMPSDHWQSEGWLWSHGEDWYVVYKFNQNAIEFSALSPRESPVGVILQFGGASLHPDASGTVPRLERGEALCFGTTFIEGPHDRFEKACYSVRKFLDEHGCRLPENFDPPVHWNEIYDNAEYILGSPGSPPRPRMTLPATYTRDLMLQEAAKAKAYGCEALYLDPGWDTDFGTFLWGEDRLGGLPEFVKELETGFGLKLALHCPLATWLSYDGRGVGAWPMEAVRRTAEGSPIERESFRAGRVQAVCLASSAYLDEAERRLLALCRDGVRFLMFDGNWWQGACDDPTHGHPVPYSFETHCRANLELAQRIHAVFPDVLIEMHDMITGGSIMRYTPVYYKYGLPRSHDENWGFELMWQPFDDIVSGKARALYYYNLACSIPIYLHIDLRNDNQNILAFWWYASTCRHLGIGGSHPNEMIAKRHIAAMQRYRTLDRFFKRGVFIGAHEEAHFHVLREENAFVVVLFNLSDAMRIVEAKVDADDLGIDRDRWYVQPFSHAEGGFDPTSGAFRIARRLDPWSAEVAVVTPVQSGMDGGRRT